MTKPETKQFFEVARIMNKILKNLKNNTLDWTYQESISSIHPEKVTYAVQLEPPTPGLAPVTWVCDSYEELKTKLEASEKYLDVEAVEKAWHETEIKRCESLIKYHKESLETDKKEDKSEKESHSTARAKKNEKD